jgi:hypothetical protein
VRSVQEPTARNAQVPGNRLGNGLCLVVTAPAHPAGAGGRPGDHIDVLDAQTANHLCREHPGSGASVAELQGNDQVFGNPLEWEGRGDAVGTT